MKIEQLSHDEIVTTLENKKKLDVKRKALKESMKNLRKKSQQAKKVIAERAKTLKKLKKEN